MKNYLPWINILTAIAAIIVNALATTLPLNGRNTASISDQFPVLFVPAGYVFAIWGLIYLGWIAFIIFQALPSQRRNPRLARLGWLFAIANVANAAWLFAWHYEQIALSVVVMLSLLVLLIAIYTRLGIGRASVSALEKLCVDVPFGLYLGWISVATIANISELLYAWRWDALGLAPEFWAVLMLGAATVIAGAIALTRADVAFLSVIVWAFVGISVKQVATPVVANTALALAVLVLVMIPLSLIYRRRVAAPNGLVMSRP